MAVICWRVTRTRKWCNRWHWNGPCPHPLPLLPEQHVTTINANKLPLSIESVSFWPAVPSHLHWGFINSDHAIPMLMAFNEIGEWNAFPFNILRAAILFHPTVSIQGLWKECWSLAHPSHQPVSVSLPAQTGTKRGKECCCLPVAGNPPIPYGQSVSQCCSSGAACETGRKQDLKSNSSNLAWLLMHCSLKTP